MPTEGDSRRLHAEPIAPSSSERPGRRSNGRQHLHSEKGLWRWQRTVSVSVYSLVLQCVAVNEAGIVQWHHFG